MALAHAVVKPAGGHISVASEVGVGKELFEPAGMSATRFYGEGALRFPSSERQDLVLEFQLAQVCHIEADDDLGRPAEPPDRPIAENS